MSSLWKFQLSVVTAIAVIVLAPGVLAGPQALASSPAVLWDSVDSGLCSFPVEVTAVGDQNVHLVHPGGDNSKVLVTGQFELTLKNLATGYTTAMSANGPASFSGTTGTLHGTEVYTYGPAGVPLEITHGVTTFDETTGLIIKQTGDQSLVDPCRLLSSAIPPPTPRATPAPWDAPADALGGMSLAGTLPGQFAFAEHIHVHLDVFVNGQSIPVPAGIGLVEPVDLGPGSDFPGLDFYDSYIGADAYLHTHDASGIIHVEAQTPETFTLGQFFDEWLVRLTSNCLGSYCNGGGSSLRVYVNGSLVTGDPSSIPLTNLAEIAVVYGPPGEPGFIPSSYAWPADYLS